MDEEDRTGMRAVDKPACNDIRSRTFPVQRIHRPKDDVQSVGFGQFGFYPFIEKAVRGAHEGVFPPGGFLDDVHRILNLVFEFFRAE